MIQGLKFGTLYSVISFQLYLHTAEKLFALQVGTNNFSICTVQQDLLILKLNSPAHLQEAHNTKQYFVKSFRNLGFWRCSFLFLVYINDIQNSSDLLDLFLLADDTTPGLYSHKSLQTLEKVVNSELIKVCEWLTVNRLKLNIQKSNM